MQRSFWITLQRKISEADINEHEFDWKIHGLPGRKAVTKTGEVEWDTKETDVRQEMNLYSSCRWKTDLMMTAENSKPDYRIKGLRTNEHRETFLNDPRNLEVCRCLAKKLQDKLFVERLTLCQQASC